AKALVLAQVPVEYIELDRRHRIQITFEHLHGLEVATDIDEQATPGEARLILNAYPRQVIAITISVEQLQESLHAPQCSYHRRSDKQGLLVRDVQTVAFNFINRRNK